PPRPTANAAAARPARTRGTRPRSARPACAPAPRPRRPAGRPRRPRRAGRRGSSPPRTGPPVAGLVEPEADPEPPADVLGLGLRRVVVERLPHRRRRQRGAPRQPAGAFASRSLAAE